MTEMFKFMKLKKPTSLRAFSSLRDWLSERLTAPWRPNAGDPAGSARKSTRLRLAVACAVVFLLASGVRLLHWQDSYLNSGLGSLTHRYLKHAGQMLDGQGILFPRDFNDPGNAQLLVHPPGYSIFAAAVFGLFGTSNDTLTLAQIIAAGAAAVMVTIIAAELFPLAVGILAGLLVAFSPHLAHYSLFLLPDSLSALPILLAVYFLTLASKRPRLITIISAGVMAGLSCWLRSNALVLAPFLALALPLMLPRGERLKYAVVFVCAAIAVASPITIRNWVVFDRFIPLSLGSGITMVEGIADYDKEKRFGMPADDGEGKWKDVEWHNRPDYAEGLWKPDGIERDRYRFSRGFEVIRRNPVWFAAVMFRRAGSMLRYNDSLSQGWPGDTARVPVVSAEPSFGHRLSLSIKDAPVWSTSAIDLLAAGTALTAQSTCSPGEEGQTIRVAGDASDFGDQFASAPIPVEVNTDYVLKVPVKLIGGRMAAKVTSEDRRIMLASHLILENNEEGEEQRSRRRAKKTADDEEGGDESDSREQSPPADERANQQGMTYAVMPFASGNRSALRFVVSNNGPSSDRSSAEIGAPELFSFGKTPQRWSRVVRPAVRGFQRNLYTTTHMLPMIAIGIILVAIAGRWRALLIVLAVPAYYLCVQSAFHTEYRYILAIHYFLFVPAGVMLYVAGAAVWAGTPRLVRAARRNF